MIMKNYSRLNVSKNREIKGSDKYITFYISLNFVSLDRIIITSSAPKTYLGISGKCLIDFPGLKAKTGLKAYKTAR